MGREMVDGIRAQKGIIRRLRAVSIVSHDGNHPTNWYPNDVRRRTLGASNAHCANENSESRDKLYEPQTKLYPSRDKDAIFDMRGHSRVVGAACNDHPRIWMAVQLDEWPFLLLS